MEEIAHLVASEPNGGTAGRLVKMWVKVALINWLTMLRNCEKRHDEAMRLLAWDMLGSALAYADWVQLVERLPGGGAPEGNLFTTTRSCSVLRSNSLQQHVVALLAQASVSLLALMW